MFRLYLTFVLHSLAEPCSLFLLCIYMVFRGRRIPYDLYIEPILLLLGLD